MHYILYELKSQACEVSEEDIALILDQNPSGYMVQSLRWDMGMASYCDYSVHLHCGQETTV
jgi:hypothetical protein